MGNTVNLQDIMNDVARALDGAAATAFFPQKQMSELDAFISLDPLLASLNKQYMDASAIRKQAQRDFGADDAMTEIALDAEDSAWCAVQTRYIELIADHALRGQANTMVSEALYEERLERAREKEREALETFQKMQYLAAHEEQKKKPDLGLWWLFLLLYFQQIPSFRLPQTTHRFNALAA